MYDNNYVDMIVYEPNKEWLQFVVNNRNNMDYYGHVRKGKRNHQPKHSIVKGPVADGNIVDFARECNEKQVTVKQGDVGDFFNRKYPNQISFHKEKYIEKL